MADNILVTAGSGTSVAADDVGGVLYQRIKLTFGIDGSATDASATDPLPVTAAALPLPSGAATAAKQAALGTAGAASTDVLTVQGIASMTALKVDGSAVTQPVSAASLPLPTGAATSANQSTISAKLPAALGQTTKSVSLAVTVASDDDLQGKLGALTETAPATDAASSGLNGRLQRVAQRLTSLIAQIPSSLGIKTAANSLSVTVASDDAVLAATGAIGDAAWASGNGTHTALLKTIATAALDTTTASPVTVRQPCDVVALTPTLDTSIYASGDTLFVTTAITGAVRVADERAVLQSVAVVDKDDQKPALRLLFFKSNVTFGTINVAPSISDADAANYLGHVDIAAADYVDLGGVSVACAKAIGLLLESASGTTTVYVAAMLTAGTPTHTASGLVLNFGLVWS